MILFVIIGGLMLIMSIFYLVNSIQQYGTWMWATFMTVLSIVIVGVGVWGMWPKWTGQEQTAGSAAKSAASSAAKSQNTSSNSSAAASIAATGKAGLTGQTSEQTAATAQKNVLTQLKKNFKSFGSVTYDEDSKTYFITPTDDNTVKSLNYIVQDPTQADAAGWSTLTGSIVKISKQLKSAMGAGYSLTVTKPASTEAMFTAKDGKTTYDIANQ